MFCLHKKLLFVYLFCLFVVAAAVYFWFLSFLEASISSRESVKLRQELEQALGYSQSALWRHQASWWGKASRRAFLSQFLLPGPFQISDQGGKVTGLLKS